MRHTEDRVHHVDTMQGDAAFIVGYSDPISVNPGGLVDFMVSTSESSYELQITRLSNRSPDDVVDDEDRTEPWFTPRTLPGREQHARLGSCVRVPGMRELLAPVDQLTVTAWLFPTVLPCAHPQVLISTVDPATGVGWELAIAEDACIVFRVCGDKAAMTAKTTAPLERRTWYFARAGYDLPDGRLLVGCQDLRTRDSTVASAVGWPGDLTRMADEILLGARHRADAQSMTVGSGHLNGRLDDVQLRRQAPTTDSGDLPRDGELLAHWDFSLDFGSTRIRDCSRFGNHGVTINMPTRAVPGHTWDGAFQDPRSQPRQYSAIHFHEDDLHEAGWEPDVRVQIPGDLRSGLYAMRLRTPTANDEIPFVVTPSRRRSASHVVVVLPTFTYLAYANIRVLTEQDSNAHGVPKERVASDSAMSLLRRHPDWGRSLYDVHLDGSGCVYASRKRPLLNLRTSYVSAVTGSKRNFSADVLLLRWLDTQKIQYDIITDEEVHKAGLRALAPYRVVVTGTHPEYCTADMLDAFHAYLSVGGRFMYLGGNGYYWVTSVHTEHPDAIEVRRGHTGTRPWTSWPGELHHSTTGEYGGLWRNRGRPPNELVGVGFSSHVWGSTAGHFERLPSSHEPEHKWIFDGVPQDALIGDSGLIMGGAAGDELDRYDEDLGSPTNAVRLATSAGLTESRSPAVEEINELLADGNATTNDRARADIVYFETSSGGKAFSVGSMCWVGSLLADGGHNHVSRITLNVLREWSLH